ncbi:MFS transporter [Phytohabitans sp. ZYX-F-186]|uniref:MFS transporter n=1 Tax=Phytohabitans maris TaxID=3071409 RepID=A0ABU0ZAS4_9ACTN|nr:MFS transporter [Phytohabitans sp. ZYX-F-186]MDQ7903455.1 MFS transporter [Phytohabitans sp. ZYX-F-186]
MLIAAVTTAALATGTRRQATPTLLLAALAVAVCQTIVVAALPVFGRELGVSATAATWLLTAFMLAAAVATPIAGRLGDLYGHRRVLVAGLLALAAGSLLAALSDHAGSFTGLLVGRAVQGLSAGVFPVTFGLARLTAPAEKLNGLVAALSAMFGMGGAVGMVVAGPIVAVSGTAWLFWLGLVLAGAALAGAAGLPAGRPATSRQGRPDLLGATLLSGTLVALLLGISQGRAWGWGSAATVSTFAGCLLLGAAFVAVEMRTAVPIVDMRLLRRPALVGTNIATVVISVGMFAAVTVIPRYSQTPTAAGYGFGDSPAETGLLIAPTAVLMVVAAPVAARLSRRTGGRATFQLGAALAVAGLGLLAFAHSQPWHFYLAGAVLGAAYGFAFASLGALVIGAVDHTQTGAASGVNTILRTIGGALGAQLAAVVLASSARPPSALPTESGYVAAFLASAAVAALAFVAALTIRRPVHYSE